MSRRGGPVQGTKGPILTTAGAAVLPGRPGEPGVGVARWIRLRAEPASAEGAVTSSTPTRRAPQRFGLAS